MFIGVGLGLDRLGGRSGSLGTLDFTAALTGATVVSTPAGYARTSTGTFTVFTANAGRRTDLGLAVEASQTNTVFNSLDMSNVYWTKTACTVSAATGPSGVSNAWNIIEDGTTNTHDVSTTASVSHTAAGIIYVWAKAGTRGWATIQLNNAGNASNVYFDLSGAGAVGSNNVLAGSSTITSGNILLLGNGWYRCGIVPVSTFGTAQLYMGFASGNGGRSYTGVNTNIAGIYWNPQCRATNIPNDSAIDTTATSATRTAENITVVAPASTTKALFKFDDDTTQLVTGLSAGTYTLPTTLNRPQIKTITWQA